MVAKVLKGSRDKRLLESNLDRLTTYGLFNNWPEKEIADWLYWLVAEGYLRMSEGQYPTVSLAASALPVLEGKEMVMQRLRTTVKRSASAGSAAASPLFEALKQWRKEAAARENVPPFMLFFDATLKELADVRPQTADELLQTKGIGAAKADKYGTEVLRIIEEHAGSSERKSPSDAQAAVPKASARAASSSDDTPSYVLSLELFNTGKSTKEVAEERGLSRVTVEGHIIRSAEEGYELDWERIIPPEHEGLIVDTIRELSAEKLRPIKDALPDEIDYFAIHGVICKYGFKAED